jgi:NADH-quinone oxidoreductase subunit J
MLAVLEIAVYAGAIMVLFLFVIMLLGAERTGRTPSVWWLQPLALVLGLILLAEALYFVFSQRGALPVSGTPSAAFGGPALIGATLFNQYLLPFEVTSILLLAAMIGAIVLSKRRT